MRKWLIVGALLTLVFWLVAIRWEDLGPSYNGRFISVEDKWTGPEKRVARFLYLGVFEVCGLYEYSRVELTFRNTQLIKVSYFDGVHPYFNKFRIHAMTFAYEKIENGLLVTQQNLDDNELPVVGIGRQGYSRAETLYDQTRLPLKTTFFDDRDSVIVCDCVPKDPINISSVGYLEW